MLIKGEIQSIDYLNNTCVVRMPWFETADVDQQITGEAVFINTPGSYNGYLAGDVVMLDFENDVYSKPVIIGKLYLGASNENNTNRGTTRCVDLNCSGNAAIPLDTELVAFKNNTGVAKNIANYSTIKDMATDLLDVVTATKNNAGLISNVTNYKLAFSNGEPLCVGLWQNKPLYRATFKLNCVVNTGNRQLSAVQDISRLNADLIFIDMAHTVKINTSGTTTSYESLGSTLRIKVLNNSLTVSGTVADDEMIAAPATTSILVTIEYTKK